MFGAAVAVAGLGEGIAEAAEPAWCPDGLLCTRRRGRPSQRTGGSVLLHGCGEAYQSFQRRRVKVSGIAALAVLRAMSATDAIMPVLGMGYRLPHIS